MLGMWVLAPRPIVPPRTLNMSPLAVIHRTQTRSTAAAHGVCPSAMAPARGVVASSPATSGLSQHTCTDLLVTSPMRKLVGFAGVSSVVTRAPSPAGGLWPTELMACMSRSRRPHTRAHRHRHTHRHTDTDTGTHTGTDTDTDTQPHTHTHSVSPLGREHSKPAVQTHRQSNVGQHRARCECPRRGNATTTADDEGRCLSLGDEHRDNSAEIAGHKLQLVPAHASRYGARETHTWKQYTHTQRGRRDACRCRCVEVAQHSGERAVRAK